MVSGRRGWQANHGGDNGEVAENGAGAGTIVGLEAEGILQLSGGVLGTETVTEDFHTIVGIASTGFGRCDLVSVDLGPIDIDALDPVLTVDVPTTDVTVRGSGAVGSLLCNLGQLLGAPGRAVQGA